MQTHFTLLLDVAKQSEIGWHIITNIIQCTTTDQATIRKS